MMHQLDMGLEAGEDAQRIQYSQAVALDANRATHTGKAWRLLIHSRFITCVARSDRCDQAGWTTTDNSDMRRARAQPITSLRRFTASSFRSRQRCVREQWNPVSEIPGR